MKFLNKKLLILGGTLLSIELIKQAQQQGAHVIVTDNDLHSPGKKVADESFLISTTDVDRVVALIKREKIDGVITGFIESMLPFYQSICEKAGLPCYGSKEQFSLATNKVEFKQLCRSFNVPVVEDYNLTSPITPKKTHNLHFPVLVKPVDHSGGRGIFICSNPKELTASFEKSLEFSPSKRLLIERMMVAEEATIYYLIQDGEIYLSAMADRHLNRSQNGVVPLPAVYIFPSKYLQAYQRDLNNQVIEMFKSIGIENGIIFIQTFVENGKFIFYEMGYRLTPTLEYKIIAKFNGINPLEMMINFALTGKMYDQPVGQYIDPDFKQYGCNITFLAKPGSIGRIEGVERAKRIKGVLDVVPNHEEGHTIPQGARGTLLQVVLRALATAGTFNKLLDVIDQLYDCIKVYGDDGSTMLLNVFETDRLRHNY